MKRDDCKTLCPCCDSQIRGRVVRRASQPLAARPPPLFVPPICGGPPSLLSISADVYLPQAAPAPLRPRRDGDDPRPRRGKRPARVCSSAPSTAFLPQFPPLCCLSNPYPCPSLSIPSSYPSSYPYP